MNAPPRPLLLLGPVLTALVACFGLLLLPAITSVGATRAPPGPRAVPAAARSCDGPACAELVEMEVRDVVPLESESHAVVLVSKDRETVLPIFVDESSALAIAFRLAHRSSPRPLAPDLLDAMMTQLGGRLTEVRIDQVDDAVFSGKVLVSQGEKTLELAARPSDSIALALAHRVKIFATRQVLASAGITQQDIDRLKQMPHHLPDPAPTPRLRPNRGQGGSGLPEPEAEAAEDLPEHRGDSIRL